MLLFHRVTVILVLISPLSSLPLTNVTEQKLVNDSNVDPLSLNLSPLVLNNNNISLNNSADVESTIRSATQSTRRSSIRSTTWWPPYSSTSRPGSSDLTGRQVALIVVGGLLFLGCCGGGTAYKSGHWETRRVWVSD